MRNYELMTIFKPNLDAEEVDKLIEKSIQSLQISVVKLNLQTKLEEKN